MRISAGLALSLALTATTALADPRVIDPAAAFPEGPLVLDGVLYYVEYGANTVKTWDGTTVKVLWTGAGCGPSAVMPLASDLMITCYDNGTLARISRDGKDLASYAADTSGQPLLGPNDFAPDGKGGLFVTASGPWETAPIVGKVYDLTPDGTLTMLADDIHYANGIAVLGDRLYVNEHYASRVISFAIGADGSLTDRREFVNVSKIDPGSPDSLPDGLKPGPDGNLWIGQYSKGRIVVVSPEGAFVKAYDFPSTATPNFTFSADGKTLYVMAVDDKDNPPYMGKVYEEPLD